MKKIAAYWCPGPNFGDQLTRYFIERLTGYEARYALPNVAPMFGCGSIVEVIPKDYTGMILGSGLMFEETVRRDLRGADVRALRGPLTAERIGIEATLGDLGLLFSLFKPDIQKVYRVGTIPHYATNDLRDPEHHFIGITAPIDDVVSEAAKCERIVSSSLHGIILADALGIENMWIKDDRVLGDGFKFRDYAASLGEKIEPGVWRLGDQERIHEIAQGLQKIVVKAIPDVYEAMNQSTQEV